MQAAVFSVSIDNEDAIKSWLEDVQGAARRAQEALDELRSKLDTEPHISITLHRNEAGE